ncbi:signal peptidase II [Leucobacter sp. M11]|uniref:signal peptidase II n=1 Tax=Leucobacter sp. M11 TaxID=2993565 RepID=UPI002D7EA6BF|nr:signal peptidase II [Leucobacter sp. M11]MEB4616586.1 signal peptidase II [Leucobacter sp. M11]
MTRAANESVQRPTKRRWWGVLLLIGVAVVVVLADQLIKNWVVAELPEGQSVPVIGEALQWHFVRNPGAAFSMASGSTWIFTILASAVVGVIIWFSGRIRSVPWALFLGLLLGGTLGNLIDRLTREPGFPEGHVIDYIYTPWMMPAIYNLADIAIVSSMILFVLITFLGVQMDGTRAPKGGRAAAEPEDATVDAALADDAASTAAGSEAAPEATPDAIPEPGTPRTTNPEGSDGTPSAPRP